MAEDQENSTQQGEEAQLIPSFCHSAWKLPISRSIQKNEDDLRDQLEIFAKSIVLTQKWCKDHAIAAGDESRERKRLKVDPSMMLGTREDDEIMKTLCSLETIDLVKNPADQERIRKLHDLICLLVHLHQCELRRQTQLIETVECNEKQQARQQRMIESLQVELEAQKQLVITRDNTLHSRVKEFTKERKQLLTQKKELQVMCDKLQGLESAFKNQFRRKEIEYNRLRKSLQDQVHRQNKREMTLEKTINDSFHQPSSKVRKASKGTEYALLQSMVRNLESKKDELLLENSALANKYEDLQRDLSNLAKHCKQAFLLQSKCVRSGNVANSNEVFQRLSDIPFDRFAPSAIAGAYGCNKLKVSEQIEKAMEKLRTHVSHFHETLKAQQSQQSTAPAILCENAILREAQNIIIEQDRLLQHAIQMPSMKDRSFGKQDTGESAGHQADFEDSMLHELAEIEKEHANLRKERQELRMQSEKLDEDRFALERNILQATFIVK